MSDRNRRSDVSFCPANNIDKGPELMSMGCGIVAHDETSRRKLVDQRYSPDECVVAGFAREFVQRVVERVRRNHFKRVLPPIAKLSNRTVGYDFLYLRDWGT